ncbi:MAG TPA: hypothetical protein VIF60_15480 [Burkholderiaceae bacterium]|jgi:hypothetical protein
MPNILPIQRMRSIACIIVALSAMMMGEYSQQADQTQPREAVDSVRTVAPLFGPGTLTHFDDAESLNMAGEKLPAYIGEVSFSDENRELVVNIDLLKVLEFYLLGEQDRNRASDLGSLRIFLTDRLTAASVEKALRIATDYRSYVTQYNALLAAQNFDRRSHAMATPDVARIKAWMQLRKRLRQNMLGDEVTNAWYENGDAQLNHVLDELQEAGNTDSFDDANRRYMSRVLERATTGFADLPRRVPLQGQ